MKVIATLAAMAAALASANANADKKQNEAVSVNKKGVILNGYDAVAYFTEEKAVKGKDDYTAEHNGATYWFANAENRDAFKANPEKYEPQYGGYCAYGVAVGKKFPVNGKAFEVIDGKLYVNLDKGIAKKWKKDKLGYIETANENWPEVKDVPAKEL